MRITRLGMGVLFVLTSLLLTVPQGDAHAAVNGLRACDDVGKRTVLRSCAVEPLDVDSIGHVLTTRNAAGKVTTYRTPASVWAYAKRTSHQCRNAGDQHACYLRDDVTGLRFIVFGSGLAVSVRTFHR